MWCVARVTCLVYINICRNQKQLMSYIMQVGTLSATDADIGVNAALQFSLVDVIRGARSLFFVNASGAIYTYSDVDRETDDIHVLRVIVTDSGYPQLTSQSDVTINVLDRNDRYPYCGQPVYSVTVVENSPVSFNSVTVIGNS